MTPDPLEILADAQLALIEIMAMLKTSSNKETVDAVREWSNTADRLKDLME